MSDERIQLAHGGGGRLMRELIADEVVRRFGPPARDLPDAARLPAPGAGLLFTTDSYVVHPLEFPGGNIGHLAVHGTVNDLAVCGGLPIWLSLAMIVEEGLPLDTLRRVLDAVRAAADDCGVTVATGDTKVVARGQCDRLYLNTAGLGLALRAFDLGPDRVRAGDEVLVSGTIAEHGLAVLAVRENIGIQDGPVSDTAPVHRLVLAAQEFGADVHFMRDPTRGGLSAVLNELSEQRDWGVLLREESVPLSPAARAVSEMLGLDPLHVASEGRVVLVCARGAGPAILDRWQALPEGRGAARVGEVVAGATAAGRVIMETVAGGRRLVDMPRGELLPRIC